MLLRALPRKGLLGEDGCNHALHGRGGLVGIHRLVEPLFSIIVDHRLGLLVEGTEALLERLLIVVLALDERLTRLIILAGNLRRVEGLVVGASGGRVDEPAADASHKR